MSKLVAAFAVALALAGPAAGQSTCAHRLFVSNYSVTVRVFDACTGEYLRDLDSPARIRGAQAVKLGPDGLLYVTSEISQQILRYRNDDLSFAGGDGAVFDPTHDAIAEANPAARLPELDSAARTQAGAG